ncbi:MAG: hypothetical protein JWQ87_5477 [Candidatus Sulfotelmatobacter sp.]|nr:hypothetical protein [Candidatus Sulfotelmatobacter sp.]
MTNEMQKLDLVIDGYVGEIPQTQVIFWQRWGATYPVAAYFLTEDPFRLMTPVWHANRNLPWMAA